MQARRRLIGEFAPAGSTTGLSGDGTMFGFDHKVSGEFTPAGSTTRSAVNSPRPVPPQRSAVEAAVPRTSQDTEPCPPLPSGDVRLARFRRPSNPSMNLTTARAPRLLRAAYDAGAPRRPGWRRPRLPPRPNLCRMYWRSQVIDKSLAGQRIWTEPVAIGDLPAHLVQPSGSS